MAVEELNVCLHPSGITESDCSGFAFPADLRWFDGDALSMACNYVEIDNFSL